MNQWKFWRRISFFFFISVISSICTQMHVNVKNDTRAESENIFVLWIWICIFRPSGTGYILLFWFVASGFRVSIYNFLETFFSAKYLSLDCVRRLKLLYGFPTPTTSFPTCPLLPPRTRRAHPSAQPPRTPTATTAATKLVHSVPRRPLLTALYWYQA